MKLDVIYNEDCLEGMKGLPDNSIDLLCTDPPYGISFMGKQWDKAIPSIDIWKECLRVLKPGAFAFVMCIPRQDCLSRMIVSLEDAGFNVSFSPIYHCFASGFPKAQNIGKAVDKRKRGDLVRQKIQYFCYKKNMTFAELAERIELPDAKKSLWDWQKDGHSPSDRSWQAIKKVLNISDKEERKFEREIVGKKKWDNSTHHFIPGKNHRERIQLDETLPATPQAQALDGSYGGFQPKPAVEVIIVAMKPLSEKTYVDQALKNKKGITWLDEGRIPLSTGDQKGEGGEIKKGTSHNWCIVKTEFAGYNKYFQGRFSANLLCSNDVLNDGKVRNCPVTKGITTGGQNFWGNHKPLGYKAGIPDSGSFSRYFSLDAWFDKKLKELPESVRRTFPFLIVPKASKAEKNKGCEALNEVIKQSANATSTGKRIDRRLGRKDMKVKLNKAKNYHPTVKPIKLMSWLITLGSREGDVILDPFIGSGTTAVACVHLKRHYIGFEINKEYYQIAQQRLEAEKTLWD